MGKNKIQAVRRRRLREEEKNIHPSIEVRTNFLAW